MGSDCVLPTSPTRQWGPRAAASGGAAGSAACGGGGVLEEYRGRGVYRNMVAHRARGAAARGVPWLQVDALPTSRAILERLGFAAITTTRPCLWPWSKGLLP